MGADPKEKPRPTARPTSSTAIERIRQNEAGARLVAKIVRELLGDRQFADAGVLRDAVEDRCTELHLAVTRDQIERAFDLVGSNAQLLAANRRRAARSTPAPDPEPAIKPAEARALLAKVGAAVSGGRLVSRPATSRLVPL